MAPAAAHQVPWHRIDTALLDLDGTLLDLAFDDWFWLEHVPRVYGATNGLTPEAARAVLAPRYQACEGTLPWYCIEHWSRELSLDIAGLAREAAARIAWLPDVQPWLTQLRESGKRLVLLTNAHPETLRLKDEQTGVARFMDAVVSSHTLGAPKEDPRFWSALESVQQFDRDRALFVDDSLPVLRAARAAGVQWIYRVRRRGRPVADDDRDFATVDSVKDLAV